MGDSVTQSELNTVINNLNANIAQNASAITNNLVGTAINLQEQINTLNNNKINNSIGSINDIDTTIIEKASKVECTLEEIVDDEHVVIKSTDGELLYCGTQKIPDPIHLFKTFYGNIYYRFYINKTVKKDNGRYSILLLDKKFFFVYDWFQETYLIASKKNCINNFSFGFEHKYDLELFQYYTTFDLVLNKSSIDKTEVLIVERNDDSHYFAILNNNKILINIPPNIIKANDYMGKTIKIPLLRKTLISNLSLYNKSFIYDNKNYNTIKPLYYINDSMSLFKEKLNNRTIVAKRNNYLEYKINLDIYIELTEINTIMFDAYLCTETIIKNNNGNFIMIFSFYNSNKYIFYDKDKKSFIIVFLTNNISQIQEESDKIGYSFIINKLYRLHYADSYSFNDGNYILNSLNGNFCTIKNNNDNSIIAMRNIFDLTNNLYAKTLNFTLMPYYEYIYKH